MITAVVVAAFLAGGSQDGARLKLSAPPKARVTASSQKAKSKAKAKPSAPKKAPTHTDPALQISDTPVGDPLAQATEGKMQCYHPDTVKRTCASLAEYIDNGDGTWSNISSVLISSKPKAVLKTITPVSVKDSAVCGWIRPEDIAAGVLTIDGRALPSDEAAPILTNIGAAMTVLYDREICTRYLPNGKDYTAKVTFNGAPNGQPDTEVMWVGPKDGYSVAP